MHRGNARLREHCVTDPRPELILGPVQEKGHVQRDYGLFQEHGRYREGTSRPVDVFWSDVPLNDSNHRPVYEITNANTGVRLYTLGGAVDGFLVVCLTSTALRRLLLQP